MRSGIQRSRGARGYSLHAIEMNKLRNRRACQGECTCALDRPRTNELAHLAMQLRDVRARERLHVWWNRIKHASSKLESLRRNLAAPRDYCAVRDLDLGPRIEHRIDRHVYVIIRNLPAPSNYSARWIIQPRPRPSYLDFLPPRQPEPSIDQAALEHDGDVFQVLVPVRGAREPDRHAHHGTAPPVHIHRSYCACSILVLRPKPQLHHVQHPFAQPDLQRIAYGKVVIVESGCR